MAEKRGCESGLAEAWCYEHGRQKEEDDRDGVITQTETLMGCGDTQATTTTKIGVCAEACDLNSQSYTVVAAVCLHNCVIMLWPSVAGCPLLSIPLSFFGSVQLAPTSEVHFSVHGDD